MKIIECVSYHTLQCNVFCVMFEVKINAIIIVERRLVCNEYHLSHNYYSTVM